MKLQTPLSAFVLFVLSAFALNGCGGGGSGNEDGGGGDDVNFSSGVSIAELDGTWFGSLEDSVGDMHTYEVTVASGALTQILIDGVSTGLTGTVVKEPSSNVVFSAVLSDGTLVGLIVDSTAAHAVFVDEDFFFGVIQKGASNLPTFLINDTDGSWNGFTVQTSSLSSNGFFEFASTGSCANLACTTNGNGVTANVDLTGPFDSVFGRWTGNYSNTLLGSGTAVVILSADKQFAGAYGCDSVEPFPDGCDFSAWVRQ